MYANNIPYFKFKKSINLELFHVLYIKRDSFVH